MKLRRADPAAAATRRQCLYPMAGHGAHHSSGCRLSTGLRGRRQRCISVVLSAGAELLLLRARHSSGQCASPANAPGLAVTGSQTKLPTALALALPGAKRLIAGHWQGVSDNTRQLLHATFLVKVTNSQVAKNTEKIAHALHDHLLATQSKAPDRFLTAAVKPGASRVVWIAHNR